LIGNAVGVGNGYGSADYMIVSVGVGPFALWTKELFAFNTVTPTVSKRDPTEPVTDDKYRLGMATQRLYRLPR
jgi:hypothetical protein